MSAYTSSKSAPSPPEVPCPAAVSGAEQRRDSRPGELVHHAGIGQVIRIADHQLGVRGDDRLGGQVVLRVEQCDALDGSRGVAQRLAELPGAGDHAVRSTRRRDEVQQYRGGAEGKESILRVPCMVDHP